MNGFQAYQFYNSLRLHFTTDFNAVKYNFKSKVNPTSFEMKKERYLFEKFARTYKPKELLLFYAANFLKDEGWPTDMKHQNYLDTKAKLDSLSYSFQKDCKRITEEAEIKKWEFEDLFKARNTFLYDIYFADMISIETLCIFEMMLKKRWMSLHSSQDPLKVYENLTHKVYKYRILLEYIGVQPTTKMAENALKELTSLPSCDNIIHTKK